MSIKNDAINPDEAVTRTIRLICRRGAPRRARVLATRFIKRFLTDKEFPIKLFRPNEPVEKVSFLKTASSAGLKIGNYFLPSKVY